jgi:hypothetical protein
MEGPQRLRPAIGPGRGLARRAAGAAVDPAIRRQGLPALHAAPMLAGGAGTRPRPEGTLAGGTAAEMPAAGMAARLAARADTGLTAAPGAATERSDRHWGAAAAAGGRLSRGTNHFPDHDGGRAVRRAGPAIPPRSPRTSMGRDGTLADRTGPQVHGDSANLRHAREGMPGATKPVAKIRQAITGVRILTGQTIHAMLAMWPQPALGAPHRARGERRSLTPSLLQRPE